MGKPKPMSDGVADGVKAGLGPTEKKAAKKFNSSVAGKTFNAQEKLAKKAIDLAKDGPTAERGKTLDKLNRRNKYTSDIK